MIQNKRFCLSFLRSFHGKQMSIKEIIFTWAQKSFFLLLEHFSTVRPITHCLLDQYSVSWHYILMYSGTGINKNAFCFYFRQMPLTPVPLLIYKHGILYQFAHKWRLPSPPSRKKKDSETFSRFSSPDPNVSRCTCTSNFVKTVSCLNTSRYFLVIIDVMLTSNACFYKEGTH